MYILAIDLHFQSIFSSQTKKQKKRKQKKPSETIRIGTNVEVSVQNLLVRWEYKHLRLCPGVICSLTSFFGCPGQHLPFHICSLIRSLVRVIVPSFHEETLCRFGMPLLSCQDCFPADCAWCDTRGEGCLVSRLSVVVVVVILLWTRWDTRPPPKSLHSGTVVSNVLVGLKRSGQKKASRMILPSLPSGRPLPPALQAYVCVYAPHRANESRNPRLWFALLFPKETRECGKGLSLISTQDDVKHGSTADRKTARNAPIFIWLNKRQ